MFACVVSDNSFRIGISENASVVCVRVFLSVCLSVCLYSVCLLVTTLHKRMNRSRCRLRRRLGWAHGTIHLVEPESPQANGQF